MAFVPRCPRYVLVLLLYDTVLTLRVAAIIRTNSSHRLLITKNNKFKAAMIFVLGIPVAGTGAIPFQGCENPGAASDGGFISGTPGRGQAVR